MKTELVDVNETRKSLSIEVPSDVVSAEIDRVARDYSRKARIPGFRPGKVQALVSGLSEFGGGLLLAAGLLTPIGAAAIAGVITLVSIIRLKPEQEEP